jgi:hypothetical protein
VSNDQPTPVWPPKADIRGCGWNIRFVPMLLKKSLVEIGES